MGILFGGLLWWTLGAGKIYIGISFILGVVNLMGSLGTDWAYGKALDITVGLTLIASALTVFALRIFY